MGHPGTRRAGFANVGLSNYFSELDDEAGAADGAGVLEDSVFAVESAAGLAALSAVLFAALPEAGLGA